MSTTYTHVINEQIDCIAKQMLDAIQTLHLELHNTYIRDINNVMGFTGVFNKLHFKSKKNTTKRYCDEIYTQHVTPDYRTFDIPHISRFIMQLGYC